MPTPVYCVERPQVCKIIGQPTMRLLLVIIATLFAAHSVVLAEPSRIALEQKQRAETARAARARALSSLYRDAAAAPVGAGLTLGQYLDRVNGVDSFKDTLETAEEIGGPRWIDAKTCQVQWEITGKRVYDAVKLIVAQHPDGPINQIKLEHASAGWIKRSFCGVGSSAENGALAQVQPAALGGQWEVVSKKSREEALSAAKMNAVRRLSDSISKVALDPHSTVGDTLDKEQQQSVESWLSSLPIGRVEFGRDLNVDVTLVVDEPQFFDVVKTAVTKSATTQPAHPAWATVEEEFYDKMARPVGRSQAEADLGEPKHAAVSLPRQPPVWVEGDLGSSGFSGGGEKEPLKIALRAESDARTKLRVRVEALPLDKTTTLGEAAKSDPRIAAAITRAVSRAKATRTEYMGEAGARVWISLDLHHVWEELQR